MRNCGPNLGLVMSSDVFSSSCQVVMPIVDSRVMDFHALNPKTMAMKTFLLSLAMASGAPDGQCGDPNANCTGCACYSTSSSCQAAGCGFQHGRCLALDQPAGCPVRMLGTMPYACRTELEATRETLKICNKKRLHPFSSEMFEGAANFAETLATYVRGVLNGSAAEYPLQFAYYTNWLTDSQVECRDFGQGPYQVGGGGEQLCNMLEWHGGLSKKNMAKYLVDLMSAADESALVKTFDSVKNFGYEAVKSLCDSTEKGWPGTVYDPSGTHDSLQELQHQQQLGRPYWGVSGGGGSGAGFGISCVGPMGEVQIITGGGGGGGGMTSPTELAAIDVGGGGGGGVSVGEAGPTVGAGTGTGAVGVGLQLELTDPQYWLVSMQLVRKKIQQCHGSGQQIVLRGGGGGGGGFMAQVPGEELPSMTFNYGFEFALAPAVAQRGGRAGALAQRQAFGDAAFVTCEGDEDHRCGCVEVEDTAVKARRLEAQSDPKVAEGIGAMFQCSSRWAANICKVASFNGKAYGQWAHYESCVCPVSHLFLAKHLPNTSEFHWIKSQHGPHCYPRQDSNQTLPALTASMIQSNCPSWCVLPSLGSHPCPMLPGCECLNGSAVAIAAGEAPSPIPALLAAAVLLTLGSLKLWRSGLAHRSRTSCVAGLPELGEEMLKP